MSPPLQVEWRGEVPYLEALALQARAVEQRRGGEDGDRLILLEHPPVVTLGRSAKEENLLESRASLARRGVDVHEIQRGGDVTYHAPGQLVGYLVVDLQRGEAPNLRGFLRSVEASLIEALAGFGLGAHRVEGMTGVYMDPDSARPRRKIASIGVGVKHWITFHGFALNITTDLAGFGAIVPCGLEGVEMTSVERELGGREPDLFERVRVCVGDAFSKRFG